MLQAINNLANEFLKNSENKKIKIISHFDTDGITSAAILAKTFSRLNKPFEIKILKNLETKYIEKLKKEIKSDEIIIFSDLGSGQLENLRELNSYILDHHQIKQTQKNIKIINPHLFNTDEISGAGLCYLFSKAINKENKDLANLAVIGMVGDMLEQNLGKLNNEILNDSEEVIIKKGLLLFGATRPLSKALEFSSSMFIPGITGNHQGALKLLRELNINKDKTVFELDREEISKLLTSILLRRTNHGKQETEKIIGNIYLIKFFNRLEDARELSALINACSRLGYPGVSISLCLGNKKARKLAEKIYASYKQEIIAGINFANNFKKQNKGYIIIDAKDKIRDSLIGTITSILSLSSIYEEGTILIGLADYGKNKIKISTRICGRNGRDLSELITRAVKPLGGEAGGHKNAAGCIINKQDKEIFLKKLEKELQIETIKI